MEPQLGYGAHGAQHHQQCQQQYQSHPPQHHHRNGTGGQTIIAAAPQPSEEMDFGQMIARKMLNTSKASSSRPQPPGSRRDDRSSRIPPPPTSCAHPRPVPPWETTTDVRRRIGDDANNGGGGLPPLLRLHDDDDGTRNRPLHPAVDIPSYYASHDDCDVASNRTALAADAAENNDDENAAAAAESNTNPPRPAEGRNVTFGTHDRIHRWDEQLDVLKQVDEEFFRVARFLVDVVNLSKGDLDEFRYSFAHDANANANANDGDVNRVNVNRNGDGNGNGAEEKGKEGSSSPLLLGGTALTAGWLPLLGCSTGKEAAVDSFGSSSCSVGSSGSQLLGVVGTTQSYGTAAPPGDDGDVPNSSREYPLTEKLVRDFVEAMEFRLENIGKEEDQVVVKRTREYARKVNAYGLPLLPSSVTKAIGPPDDDQIGEEGVPFSPGKRANDMEEDDEDDEEFLDTFGKGINPVKTKFFPVLPTNSDDDDENDDGGYDENDHGIFNRQPPRPRGDKPQNAKESSDRADCFQLPTPASVCASLLRPQSSATPSEDDCRERLSQIRREIDKARRMIDSTRNASVRAACRTRVSRLGVERRMYQIIRERHKVQTMMETTEVPYVRKACKERFDQLILELRTLRLDDEEEEEAKDLEEEKEKKAEDVVEKTKTGAEEEGLACELVCGTTKLAISDGSGSVKPVKPEGAQARSSDDHSHTRSPYGVCTPLSTYGGHTALGRPYLEDTQVTKGTPCIGVSDDTVRTKWYDQVLKYMTGEPPLHTEFGEARRDEHARRRESEKGRPPPERKENDLERPWQDQQYLQRRPPPERKVCDSEGERPSQDQQCKQQRPPPERKEYNPEQRWNTNQYSQHGLLPKRRGYEPEQPWQDQQYSQQPHSSPGRHQGLGQNQQHGARSQVRFSENLHYDHYGPKPRRGSEGRRDGYQDANQGSVASPRSDEAVYQDGRTPEGRQGQRRRSPVPRRPSPAAIAVKPSSSWLDDVKDLF